MNLNDWDMGTSGSLLFDDNYINGGTTLPDTSMEFTSTKR